MRRNRSLPLVWAPVALQDLDELLAYIAFHDSLEAAIRVHSKILERTDTISSFPERCRIVPELKQIGVNEYRELIVWPHRIFFRIGESQINLIGILDGRRDLGEILIERSLRT